MENQPKRKRCRRAHLDGQRFGRLLVLRREYRERDGAAGWLCLCDCGRTHFAHTTRLTDGGTRSCGCLSRETARRTHWKHGRSNTHEWYCWNGMRKRCFKPAETGYHNYGGRGIGVCERWETFENFLADMGEAPTPAHSIDRKDVNGDYCPENCRWATPLEQGRNRRINRMVTYQGRTQCVSAWAEELNIGKETLGNRIRRGWPLERAMGSPVNPKLSEQGKRGGRPAQRQ